MNLSPAYKIALGGQLIDTTDEPQASTLVDLTVALDMQVASDEFKLKLGNVGHFLPEREDEGVIELGYADDESGLVQVIAGQVDYVVQGSTIDRIHGYSAADILLRSYLDQTFENKSAGDIVSELAATAGITTASIDDGINFPAYVIDSNQSFYHHMQTLAQLCGFDVYFNSDNALVFARFTGGNRVHIFEHREHIIELDIAYRQAIAGKIEAWGESGSNNGDESWAWLTKDFAANSGSAGNSDPTVLLQRAALRTGTAAQSAADAAFTETTRNQITGTVKSLGRPQVKLGDAIRLNGLPESRFNQTYQVRAVLHRITKLHGFTTQIEFSSLEQNGGGFLL